MEKPQPTANTASRLSRECCAGESAGKPISSSPFSAFNGDGARTRQGRILSSLICTLPAGNSRKAGRCLSCAGGFRKVFVALEMNRYSELAFHGPDSSDPAAAADPHIFSQRDLGLHHESKFDGVAFRDLKVGVEKCSAPAQVLGKTAALAVSTRQTHSYRQLKVEAL